MIAKKNPRYNLEGKRIVIFSLGLLTTTAATLAAFTYQTPFEHELEKQKINPIAIDYMVEEQKPIIKPIEPVIQQVQQPQTQSDASQSTSTSTSVDVSQEIVSITSRLELPDLGILGRPDVVIGGTGGTEIERDNIDPFPKIEAQFVGGYPKLQEFILKNTKYPEQDLDMGITGVVWVSFVIERDGTVTNVVIEKGVSANLDREAKRVVKNFPKWIPGESEAEKVRTIVRLPIRFISE